MQYAYLQDTVVSVLLFASQTILTVASTTVSGLEKLIWYTLEDGSS